MPPWIRSSLPWLGLWTLVLIREWAPLLLFPGSDVQSSIQPFYEALSYPPAAFLAPVLWVLALSTLLGVAESRGLGKFSLLRSALVVVGLWRALELDPALEAAARVGALWLRTRLSWVGLCVLGVALAGVLCRTSFRTFPSLARVTGAFGVTLVPFFLWAASHCLYRAFSPRWQPANVAAPASRPAARRVVWFVFDKWDYHEGWAQPLEGVPLDHLRRWAKEGWEAHRAYAPGNTTNRSLPAYLRGAPVSGPLHWVDGALWVGTPSHREKWNELPTIVRTLHAQGLRTGVYGYYLPWCRLAPEAVDCHRMPVSAREVRPAADHLSSALEKVARDAWGTERSRHGLHPANFHRLRQAVRRAVGDPTLSLVFVHWPVPHEPHFYDRRGSFPLEGDRGLNYADSLHLLDQLVGELAEDLSVRGLEDRTAVVLTSDHPNYETGGRERDPRVPLFVRWPGSDRGVWEQPLEVVKLSSQIPGWLEAGWPDGERLGRALKREGEVPTIPFETSRLPTSSVRSKASAASTPSSHAPADAG